MILKPTHSIRAFIQGAPQTTQPVVIADFADITATTFDQDNNDGVVLNGATPVTIVPASSTGVKRLVKTLILSNIDTQANEFVVQIDFNGTPRQIMKETVQPGKVLMYIHGFGWSNGFQHQGPQGPAGPAGASYIHTQASAAAVWTVNHNLGFKPDITLFSSGSVIFDAQITHLNDNQAQVDLDTAVTGIARCE